MAVNLAHVSINAFNLMLSKKSIGIKKKKQYTYCILSFTKIFSILPFIFSYVFYGDFAIKKSKVLNKY